MFCLSASSLLHRVSELQEETAVCGNALPFVQTGLNLRLSVDGIAQCDETARELGVRRVFCLTFEVEFFSRHGFGVIDGVPVQHEVFEQILKSYDEGVAEFLDLERVKPNTLGNSRMLLSL